MIAAEGGAAKALKMLIHMGANLDIVDDKGRSVAAAIATTTNITTNHYNHFHQDRAD